MDYYWPTMVKDALEFSKHCQACQLHRDFIRQPPKLLCPIVASWIFYGWGLDVVRPFPRSSRQHLYVLAATNYFSKWAKAVPLREVKKGTVVDFIKNSIVDRYGISHYIVTDNGKPFSNSLMGQFYKKFGIKQKFSTMYNAATNGLMESFNKTLCKLLQKVVSKSKQNWHKRIGEVLWAYCTSHRIPT